VFELGDEIHDQITQTMVLRSVIWLLLLLLLALLGRSWLQVLYAGARFASNEWENRALPVVMTAPALAETVSAGNSVGERRAGRQWHDAGGDEEEVCIIDDLFASSKPASKEGRNSCVCGEIAKHNSIPARSRARVRVLHPYTRQA
jgi:hypothetical protein